MNDKWTDFEKFVHSELKELQRGINRVHVKLSRYEGKAAAWGALAGIVFSVLGEYFSRVLFKN